MFDRDHLEPERVRPLSRREYDTLVELGAFEDERIELLRGVLVTMSPQGDVHAGLTAWLARYLILATQGRYDVRTHSPFAADDLSEPEPDVSISPRDDDRFAHPAHPLLLIEVADSSLRKDRTIKLPIYAAAGVPEYWIVDVAARAITVYTKPVGDAYTATQRFEGAIGVLTPVAVSGVALAMSELRWA